MIIAICLCYLLIASGVAGAISTTYEKDAAPFYLFVISLGLGLIWPSTLSALLTIYLLKGMKFK